MDCGDALWCQALNWLADNEYVAETLARTLADLGKNLDGFLGDVVLFVKDHFDKLLALAVSSLGFYKWWRYREQILHRRLNEFISEGDRRLVDGRGYVLKALQRPAPGQKFKLPLFADRHLLSVLRERNWDRTPVAPTIMSSCELQLSDAMSSIQRKIETAEQHISSLRLQMATAHILHGAIHSTRSAQRSAGQRGNLQALHAFRSALLIPGQEEDMAARELEAHQLRKLGMLPQALKAYEDLEQLSSNIPHDRPRRLQMARCRRYRAEILQVQASVLLPNGSRQFHGAGAANSLLSGTIPGSALTILASLQPLQSWERLEEGDTQYLAAFVAQNLGFGQRTMANLNDAETAYESVLSSPVRLFKRRATDHLRKKASEGLARVKKAQLNTANFDVDWLCP